MGLPSISLVTAVWGRPSLTKYALRYYQRLRNELDGLLELRLLAVGSEGEQSRTLCIRQGFEYIEYPNRPLNYKWNAVVRAARSHDTDAVVIVGSDDIVSSNYFSAISSRMKPGGTEVIALDDLYFLDLQRCRLAYWRNYPDGMESSAVGLGRFFPRAVLDALDWAPWSVDTPRNSGLDGSCTRKLAAMDIGFDTYSMEQLDVIAVDLKGCGNVNSWDSLGLGEGVESNRTRSILDRLNIGDLCTRGWD